MKLQIGSSIVHDASRTYDENALKIIHPTATSNTAINDPMPILYLGRDGTSGVAYGALATFKLCRFEESSFKSKTRLDIDLTDDYFVDQNVMTLLANGSVGIGTTSPGAKLEVSV